MRCDKQSYLVLLKAPREQRNKECRLCSRLCAMPNRKSSIKILEQAEKGEQTVAAVCREHGIAENTFYRWRKAYGGMSLNEVQRLKDLEKENARLKRLLAERDLEVDALK